MSILLIPVIYFVAGLVIIQIINGNKSKYMANQESAEIANAEREAKEKERGEAVRVLCYRAYRGMLKQHAAGLWRLTACVGYSGAVDMGVARVALEETLAALAGRYNCGPINEALDEIENL